MSGALVTATQKIARDVRGTPSAPEASGPHPEPVRLFTTDLGNIEHIIGGGGLVQNVSERVSTALTKASDSLRGPNGGLLPSALQHAPAGGVSVVERDVTAIEGGGRSMLDRVRTGLAELRTRLHV